MISVPWFKGGQAVGRGDSIGNASSAVSPEVRKATATSDPPKSPKAAELEAIFPSKIRLHREFFDIDEDIKLECYWISVNGDKGPGAELYLLGIPLLKFDCVGFPKGHFHAYIGPKMPDGRHPQDRLHLPERGMMDQVRRCAFELRWNIRYYSQRHKNTHVQLLELKESSVNSAAELMEKQLLDYCRTMPARYAEVVVVDQVPVSKAWTDLENSSKKSTS